jgi:hypothetical protein
MKITNLIQKRGRRGLVVFLGHAPALWLFYREPLPKRLRVPNIIAATLTVGFMVAVYHAAAPPWRVRGALVVWLAGHLAWGAYVAREVRE